MQLCWILKEGRGVGFMQGPEEGWCRLGGRQESSPQRQQVVAHSGLRGTCG